MFTVREVRAATSPLLPVFGSLPDFHLTDIHLIATHTEFVVDNVLHNVGFFLLTEIYQRITNAQILKVVFRLCANVLPSFHIITLCFTDDKGIFKIKEILVDSLARDI